MAASWRDPPSYIFIYSGGWFINLIDLKWLKRCQRQLKDMAEDPAYAEKIKEVLDQDPELREELPHIYVKALKTLESIRKK